MTKAEEIARVAHHVNRAYCQATGDDSQPLWEDAPDWQRDSAINGVRAHLTEPRTPEESHELWMAAKSNDGWVWGPVKDPEKKQHPCMVLHENLPADQKVKDYLFSAVVEAMKAE